MENASKALIMAGSVLIALMIIGALLLMINNLSSYQESDTVTTREAQVIDFNNQYETYNRKNVRGSDLYSLLNRAVDYNRRKSTTGTGATDEGKFLAYIPMEITFDLTPGGGKEEFYATKESGFTHLINDNIYTVSDTNNQFEKNIKSTVDTLETMYGSDSLNNLVIGMSKIFIDSTSPDEQKVAKDTFNIASKKVSVSSFSDLFNSGLNKNRKSHEENVYTYAEYVQFKRAKFDCITDEVKYDSKTGRIIKMKFNFTGKFE